MDQDKLSMLISQDAIKEIKQETSAFIESGKAVKVIDNESFSNVGQLLLTIKERIKRIDGKLEKPRILANELHKSITSLIAELKEPYLQLEKHFKGELAQWNAEQEKIRRAEEERLQELARKEEQERRLNEAVAAEQAGHKEEAEAIISTPIQAPPVVVPKSVPKVAGVSFTKQWKFRIINIAIVPREYLSVNEVAIGQVVRALKDQTNIPGIEVYPVDGVSGRAAA